MIRIDNEFTGYFSPGSLIHEPRSTPGLHGTKDRPTKQFEREEQRLKYESAQAELAAAAAGKHDLAC